ncbi:hypothetical protein Back11_04530 [Paenibacillus baekrokdamisoli]|uniref:Uncharacterized protein n=1 Tax=Paenibacillus baekrokdamisoli TaxID=1712516 RepID=A0A3G9J5U8_9BACL|nr:hypothetical protein [Paenibacillus baekrokdamisoli]MBB3067707.1 hypothetical protein [Paenibacillus baekrokdamisoli]BBH19108.1 hypothetical protein Back11_04530 [Paenibacillus baekrokdamisoli]
MNRIPAVVNIHWRDKTVWLVVPWLILTSSFVVNLVVGLFMKEGEYIYSGGLASIFIYILVVGILTLSQSFPFALGLSVRRTDYFLGTGIAALGISFITGILLYLLSFIENDLTDGWGVRVHFFHLPYLNDGTPLEQLFIYFMSMLAIFFFGFMIASIYRRFGRMGMFVCSLLVLVFGTIGSYMMTHFGLWMDMFEVLKPLSAFMLALWLIPITACTTGISYLLLRRASM